MVEKSPKNVLDLFCTVSLCPDAVASSNCRENQVIISVEDNQI